MNPEANCCGRLRDFLKKYSKLNYYIIYRNLPCAYCEQVGKEIRDISDVIPFDIPDSWEWIRLLVDSVGMYYVPPVFKILSTEINFQNKE